MLLTTDDLRKRLGIGRDRAYALMHAKSFPAMKMGGRYYISEEALERWIRGMEHKKMEL